MPGHTAAAPDAAGPIHRADGVLGPTELALMDRLWHDYGARRRRPPDRARARRDGRPYAPHVAGRCDAARHFLATGGRRGHRGEPRWLLRSRTAYFRDHYVTDPQAAASGELGPLVDHPSFRAAAAAVHGRSVVVPALLYGNILLPGQELGVHTDVPAFRGVDRSGLPLWLLVVMHHSGLFARWRIPIATAVAYLSTGEGGELAAYPDRSTAAVLLAPVPGSVVAFDADTVFHGIDRVGGDDRAIRAVGRGSMALASAGDRRWRLRIRARGADVGEAWLASEELRYSLSWKGYCFADDADRRRWEAHEDDLDPTTVVDTLTTELKARGVDGVDTASDAGLAHLLIDTFVRFPDTGPAHNGRDPRSGARYETPAAAAPGIRSPGRR